MLMVILTVMIQIVMDHLTLITKLLLFFYPQKESYVFGIFEINLYFSSCHVAVK